ncbi:MAG: hypothetical protein LBK66_14195 [Spirochaetaceae bacterium]|nr:hypothetical protein [Spirochaetaceae bacterium]
MFNDLSLDPFYNDFSTFKKVLGEIVHFYNIGTKNGHIIYLHRDSFFNIRVSDVMFRQAMNDSKNIDRQQKMQMLGILDKSKHILPDDSAIPCDFVFFHGENKLPNTGLSECAFRKFMGEDASLYSLSISLNFHHAVIPINIQQNDIFISNEFIKNYFSLETYLQKVQSLLKPPGTWDDFFNFITDNFIWLEITDDAKKTLRRVSFKKNLIESIIQRFDVLNKMAGSESEAAFLEVYEKYCQGDRAWFSDESETRKNKLKEKLTFLINGKNILCSYHGKISHDNFRIHISSTPKRHEKIYVAYIGSKIL